jgi:hypothetical protein
MIIFTTDFDCFGLSVSNYHCSYLILLFQTLILLLMMLIIVVVLYMSCITCDTLALSLTLPSNKCHRELSKDVILVYISSLITFLVYLGMQKARACESLAGRDALLSCCDSE